MVAAGRKAAETRKNSSYTFEQHLEGLSDSIKGLAMELREFILNLEETVEESPKKFHIAYKVAKNFACIQTQKKKLNLYLKLNPSEFPDRPPNARDVSHLGHQGTGDLELTIQTREEVEAAHDWIRKAFERVGG
jgi:predicted transport protein